MQAAMAGLRPWRGCVRVPVSLVPVQTTPFEAARPADYLTRLAVSDMGRAYKGLVVSEMAIRPGDVVLDLGCGPGTDLPAFADAAGVSGRVIGVDSDPDAVRKARGRTADLPQVEVHEADIHAPGLAAASVDRVHTDRVLQHVANPETVLTHARRALRDGGSAAFAEPDWDTLIIDYPDVKVARSYTRYITDHVVRNAVIGRQLARLAAATGFRVDKVIPLTAVWRDAQEADKILGLQRVTARAVHAGQLAQDTAQEWLTYLASQAFFASTTLYVVTATAI
jgi:ubiquinone/menaquinone biosynthesis C-methylase UbiE